MTKFRSRTNILNALYEDGSWKPCEAYILEVVLNGQIISELSQIVTPITQQAIATKIGNVLKTKLRQTDFPQNIKIQSRELDEKGGRSKRSINLFQGRIKADMNKAGIRWEHKGSGDRLNRQLAALKKDHNAKLAKHQNNVDRNILVEALKYTF